MNASHRTPPALLRRRFLQATAPAGMVAAGSSPAALAARIAAEQQTW